MRIRRSVLGRACLVCLLLLCCAALVSCGGVRVVPQPANEGHRAQPPLQRQRMGGGFPLIVGDVTLDLPFPYATLEDSGFTLTPSSSEPLPPDELSEPVSAVRGALRMDVYFYNPSGDVKPLEECVAVWLDVTGSALVALESNIRIGATMDSVLLAYGDPEESYEDGGRDVLAYGTGLYMGLNLHFSKDTFLLERIESFHLPTASGVEGTGAARIAAALAYQPPKELGQDPVSGCYQLDGELYQLPTPFSAFTLNGWEVVGFEGEEESDSRFVVNAQDVAAVQLKREETTLYLLAYNLSPYSVSLGDCFLLSVSVNQNDGEELLLLPGGLRLGMTVAQLEQTVPGLAFDGICYNLYSDDEHYDLMAYRDEKSKKLVSLSLICEDSALPDMEVLP